MHLVDDDLRRDLGPAERDVEVVGLAEAHLADDVGEQRRAGDLLRRAGPALRRCSWSSSRPACSASWRDSALKNCLILLRARVVLTTASQSRDGPRSRLQVSTSTMSPDLQLVVQRHDLAVDLRADAAVADLGVDLVGEVQRRRPGGQRLDLALGREDEDLLVEEVDLEVLHELLRVGELLLPVEHRAQPLQLRLALRDLHAAAAGVGLVEPVRGDAELGQLVHLARADLDLQRQPLGTDHRRVQRLVHVELRHRDEVLEAPRQRLPQRVDDADRAVAVLDRVDDHAHRREVVDLVELAALAGHLRVDRVEVLRAAGDLARWMPSASSSLRERMRRPGRRSARARRAAG